MAPEGVTVTVTPIPPVIGGPSSVQSPTSLAPGFRFHPTDEELVTYYLKRKVCGKPFRIEAVAEIDVYKSEPWELAGFSSLKTRDLEWYFFSPVDRKYGNGSRLNRATGQGYWKATGKDRSVRHKSQPIGMKKTLVFHIGRAPDGRRTNWVMHEYRLVDEEIERVGMVQDAFVLCRIFQKSGLGPPNGDRYAPFLDEEWDDDNNGAPPYARGGEADDEMANGDELRVGLNGLEQDKNKRPLLLENSYEPKGIEFLCKRERSDDEDMEILSLGQTKRSKRDDPSSSNPNGSQDSTTTMQDDPMTKMMMTTTTTTTNFSSELLEFPIEPKGNQSSNAPVTFDSSNLEKSVPPGYLKFISNLENEIMNISMEKETLKIEMMRAQATINILQSRIDIFSKENEGLRRAARGGGN